MTATPINPVKIRCRHCGRDFLDFPSRASLRRYCSNDCRYQHKRGKHGANAGGGAWAGRVGRVGRVRPGLQTLVRQMEAGWPTATTVEKTSNKAKFGRPTSGPSRGGPSYGLTDRALAAQWPTAVAVAADADRGPESRETKDARGAGGINQREAIKKAGPWPTALGRDGKGQSGQLTNMLTPKPKNDQPAAIKQANWQSPVGADGGSVSLGGERRGEMLLGGQVKAANWQTCVAEDQEQSGSAARGPSQTSQTRQASTLWATPATPATRDHKGGKASQETHDRNSRPLNEQVIRAAGPMPSGSTPKATRSRRRSTTGSHPGSSPEPPASTPAGGSP
jgi:hypothetical protein